MSVSGVCNRVKSAGWGVYFGTEAVVRGSLGGIVVAGSVITVANTIFDIYHNKPMTYLDFFTRQQVMQGSTMIVGFDIIGSMHKAIKKSWHHFGEAISPTPPSYTRRMWSYLRGQ